LSTCQWRRLSPSAASSSPSEDSDPVTQVERTVFAEVMAGWSAEERRTFGRLLTEFVRRYEKISR
jgi:hypothetical protein